MCRFYAYVYQIHIKYIHDIAYRCVRYINAIYPDICLLMCPHQEIVSCLQCSMVFSWVFAKGIICPVLVS